MCCCCCFCGCVFVCVCVCVCVISWLRFENSFEKFYDNDSQQFANSGVPFPPRYFTDRYMHSALVYDATFATTEVGAGKGGRGACQLPSATGYLVAVVRLLLTT